MKKRRKLKNIKSAQKTRQRSIDERKANEGLIEKLNLKIQKSDKMLKQQNEHIRVQGESILNANEREEEFRLNANERETYWTNYVFTWIKKLGS